MNDDKIILQYKNNEYLYKLTIPLIFLEFFIAIKKE